MVKDTFERNKPSSNPLPPPLIESFALTIDVTGTVLTTAQVVLTGSGNASYKVLVYGTSPQGAGIMSPRFGSFKLLVAADAVFSPTAISFASAYQMKFGVPAVANKIFIKIVMIDSTSGAKFTIGHKGHVVT